MMPGWPLPRWSIQGGFK